MVYTYEQTIKDIDNGLRFLNTNGVILIHDCLQKNLESNSTKIIWALEWRCMESNCSSRTYGHADTYTCIADHGIGVILEGKIEIN